MIKNFLDADEDDSMTAKKSFNEEPKVEKDFEEFAAPFSKIEDQKFDLLEIPESKNDAPIQETASESNESVIFNPEFEPVADTSHEAKIEDSSAPKMEKPKPENFWERKLEVLKSDDFNRHSNFEADDFQDDDFDTIVRPKDGQPDFDATKNVEPTIFETPVENETVDYKPVIESEPVKFESPIRAEQTNFVLPNLDKNQSFAESNDEIKNETTSETNGVRRREDAPLFSQSPYHSENPDETIRRSGLAYTAAIVLFASIVFTLILGWFADLLLGTSPWGKVGGIILGAIIGFVQFFRTTSQILKNKD